MIAVHGRNTPCYHRVKFWVMKVKCGRESFDGDHRNMEAIILQGRHCYSSYELGILVGTVSS